MEQRPTKIIPHYDIWDLVMNFMNYPFRFWVYRRVYTPYEQSNKFSDESWFEDPICKTAYVRECYELPDGDILLGFVDVEYSEDEDKCVEYYKLSEIRLERFEEGDEKSI